MRSTTQLHIIISIFCSLAATDPSGPLQQASVVASLQSTIVATTGEEVRVPGNNNATFCNVLSEKQLFNVEFLEVAPCPLPVNQIFFVYLRGTAPDEPGLDNAGLRLTSEAVLASGEHEEPISYTVPLKTTSLADSAHLAVRNATGANGGPLTPGRNDVLADYWISGLYLRTGWWTFHIEGVLPDGRCLFCFKTSQWFEHRNL